MAVASDGQTTVTWWRLNGNGRRIVQAATRAARPTMFGAPENLSTGPDSEYPQVAVAPDGQATVAWKDYGGANYIVQAVSSAATQYGLAVARSGSGSGTVTSSPAGIACGSVCSYDFNRSTQVTLSASAASGSTFTGWDGAGYRNPSLSNPPVAQRAH